MVRGGSRIRLALYLLLGGSFEWLHQRGVSVRWLTDGLLIFSGSRVEAWIEAWARLGHGVI